MPLLALAFLLLAAALHTGWNLLLKQSLEKQVFAWWVVALGAVIFAPALLASPPLPAAVWPYLAVSATVEGVYFYVLTRAYQHGDFSVVYPLARGGAPALLSVWALLFLGEHPSVAGFAGLVLLIAGLILAGGLEWWRQRGSVQKGGVLLALATALCISVYTLIDGVAVRQADPITYVVLLLGATAALTAPLMLVRYGHERMLREWRVNWRRLVLGAVLSLLAYALALEAYSLSKLAYAGAVREVSVVLAALAGWRFLGESFGPLRTAGAALIFAGIVILAAAG